MSDRKKKKEVKVRTKGDNPNHFPEQTIDEQQDLPYEGDDKKGAMEDAEQNDEL